MKKIKKLLALALTALTISSLNVLTVHAETNTPEENCSTEILFYDPGLSGYEYVPSRKSFADNVNWRHEANNWVSGTTDNIQRSVSRTVSTSLSSSQSATVNGMIAQANVGFEVSIGASATWSTTTTFSIPYGRYECQYGSKYVYTNGTENYWSICKLQSSKYVNGNWSYMSFSNKVKL